MSVRQIVQIDEEKCDGCELCVPSCAEGAIQMINGKARLVSDTYCDGLGACLGECPQDAIIIIEREADEYDDEAVEKHLAEQKRESLVQRPQPVTLKPEPPVHACPGSMSQALNPGQQAPAEANPGGGGPSQLSNWPVQLNLAPVKAPYFDGAQVLIAADCVPFATPDFHRDFLAGRILLIGCPKLDDINHYREKLAQIFQENNIRSIEVAFMEVPCCFGLVQVVKQALEDSGADIPFSVTRVGIRGAVDEAEKISIKAG